MTAVLSDAFRSQEPTPGTTVPSEAELRRAFESIPEDLNWEWARPRLTPLFERADSDGVPGDPALHTVTPLGVAVGYGIEAGPTFLRVTESMAQRWEANLEQIETAAFEHLARAVRAVGPRQLQHAVHRSHMARCLPEPGGWASSAILAGEEEVRRIFGGHDQVLTVPTRNMILSFDASVPAHAVASVTAMMEDADPHPLLLDAFALVDGRLCWTGLAALAEDELLS